MTIESAEGGGRDNLRTGKPPMAIADVHAIRKGGHPVLQGMIRGVMDEGAALQQRIGKKPLQFRLYKEIKLPVSLTGSLTSGAGILIEEPVKIRVHPAEEDQGIERGAVLHGAGVYLGAAKDVYKGAGRGELFLGRHIYIDQEIVRKLMAPAIGMIVPDDVVNQRLCLATERCGTDDTQHQLGLQVQLPFRIVRITGMGTYERTGPGIVVGLEVGIDDIIRRIHDLHRPPAIDIDGAVAGRGHPLVQKKTGWVAGFVKIVDAGAVGIGVIGSVEPDIDKIVVLVEPDQMRHRVVRRFARLCKYRKGTAKETEAQQQGDYKPVHGLR